MGENDYILGGAYQQATGATVLNWYFENPVGSGVTLRFDNITIQSTGPCRIQAVSQVASYTGGTAKRPDCTTSAYAALAVLKVGITPTGGTTSDAEGYSNVGQTFSFDVPFILPAGVNVMFQATPEVFANTVTSVNLVGRWRET